LFLPSLARRDHASLPVVIAPRHPPVFFACAAFLASGALARTTSPTDTSGATVLSAPASPYAHLTGLELGSLTVGRTTYHAVRVRSRDARSLQFSHRDGLASVRLRDLPADVQARVEFDPLTAPPDTPAPPARPPASPPPSRPSSVASTSGLDQLVRTFSQPAELRSEQSLQAEFIALNLAAKNQGRRPSCAIYAVVSALEFQNARQSGGLEKLSEEYLLWATRTHLGQGATDALPRDEAGEPLADTGYTLPSVFDALSSFGIPRYDDMPNLPGISPDAITPPSEELVARARGRLSIFVAPLPGAEAAERVNSLVHALNAGFPVPAGLRWPHERSINGGVLSAQRPLADAAHAVTFVGYVSPSERIEDASFIFKNSYGPRWGQGGYGRATWGYLSQHLLDAYVIDVRPASARP
jgi:hypothetical protein